MRIKDLKLVSKYCIVSYDMPVKEAAKRLLRMGGYANSIVLIGKDINSIPDGVIGAREIVGNIAQGLNLQKAYAKDIMNPNILQIDSNYTLEDGVAQINKEEPYAVILTDNGHFDGFFSPMDFKNAVDKLANADNS